MLDNLYSNIGAKIKNLAKWIGIIETVSAIIGGISLLVEEELLYGLLCLIAGPVVAFVSTWILYAFGEITEDICLMRQKYVGDKVVETKKEYVQPKPKQPAPTPRATVSTNTANITQAEKAPQPIFAKSEKSSAVIARQDSMESKPTQKKVYAEGEFVPGRNYTNGDEVIFENKKYVCLASGTTVWSPSQFPSQWKEISAEEIWS